MPAKSGRSTSMSARFSQAATPWSGRCCRTGEIGGGLNRLCVFRNHSKIYAGEGDKFAFAIETSANINTNPRTEQGVVTIDRGLYEFYKAYFDGIESFEKL